MIKFHPSLFLNQIDQINENKVIMKMSKEEELIKILQSKQEELSKLNEEKEHLESLTEDAERIINEQLPDEFTEDEIPDEILEYSPDGQYAYPKYGIIVCPVCDRRFQGIKSFSKHWQETHEQKYGTYEHYPSYSEKKSEEEIPKEELKKDLTPLTPEQAIEKWIALKKTKRRKE